MAGQEMAAAYTVTITGVTRTKAEMKKLSNAIASLRKAEYSPGASVTREVNLGGSDDLLITKIDALEGRVQSATQDAMASSMALGRKTQTAALNAAVTTTGLSRPGGSAGRNETGAMINAIGTNVETAKTASETQITGWHGWGTEARGGRPDGKITTQEKGNKGAKSTSLKSAAGRSKTRTRAPIVAANSLGQTIPVVRENLKKELGKLR